MRITSFIVVAILFSTPIFSQTQTSLTIPSNTSTSTAPKKPQSCYLADASEKISNYFVTASIIYLTGVNLVMPILSGFILPIVLAKLVSPKTIPTTEIPAVIIPVAATSREEPIDSPSHTTTTLLSGTASFFGLFANPITYVIANKVSSTGITATDVVGTAPSGLSAKDIVNIATALMGAGAKIWDYVQHALCESDK
jgi:hypothetical protein